MRAVDGLDPEERIRFLNILAELGEDAIVLLSTHIVADVAAVCSRVAIIDLGEIRLTGDPRTVSGTLERRLWQKAVAKRELETVKRFDMPGYRPNEHYFREMQHFGIVPAHQTLEDPIDVYAADQAFWQSAWHRPTKR